MSFMSSLLRPFATTLLTLLLADAHAETAPLPDGFGITPSKRLERLIHAERTGELPLKDGEHVPLTLTFQDKGGKRFTVDVHAAVRPLGAPASAHKH